MDRTRVFDAKAILSIVGLLLTLCSIGIGVGWRLLDDRMQVEAVTVEMRTTMRALRADVGEMKEAINILAKNSTDILVLTERVNAHDKQIDKQEARLDRLEAQR